MKLFFTILFCIGSFSLFAAQRNVDLRWEFAPAIAEKVHLYRLEVVQIINGEHNLVLTKMIKESHFNWSTDRSGFFIMRVFPLTENGKIIQDAEIEKPLYWESELIDGKEKPLYLCGNNQQWQWDSLPGRNKFLIRLTRPQDKTVASEKIVRSHFVKLENNLFKESHIYRLLILAYDNKGKIDLIRDERMIAKNCADRPLPDWFHFKGVASRIAYRPQAQSRQQQLNQTLRYSGTSWMRFFAEVTQDENNKWSNSADFSYSSFCSKLAFCQDQVELRVKRAYRMNDQWLSSVALDYQNLSFINMAAYEQNSREVEDRAHLFSFQLGVSYRFHLWRKQSELSSLISYTPFSYYVSGEENNTDTTALSGYGVQFAHRLYFSGQWHFQSDLSYQRYEGQGSVSIASFSAGPVYQF